MKKALLIGLPLLCLLLGACTPNNRNALSSNNSSDETNDLSSSNTDSSSSVESSSNSSSSSVEEDEIDDDLIVRLDRDELIVQISKRANSLITVFPDGYSGSTDGTWVSQDENIASIDQYGRVTGVSKGSTYVWYALTSGIKSTKCRVYSVESVENLTKSWQKVSDVDSIKPGDEIVFGCPEFGAVASLNRKNGYLKHTSASFSSDKSQITSLSEDAGRFYVGNGEEDSLTL